MKAPPFHISPGTEVRVRGQLQVIDKITDSGLVTLVCPLRHTELKFELHELVTMRMDGILTPVLPEPTTHQVARPPTYTPQSKETRARVARRIAYAQFAATLYPIGPHSSRLKAAISERLFLMGCQNWPVRVPTSTTEFDAAVALSKNSTLQQSGLWFLRLQYQNDLLGDLWNRSPNGTRLQFKVNPLNLQSILVRHPVTGEYFRVDCVDDYQWPRTMSMHLAVRAHARKLGLSPDERRQLALAESDLMKMYAEAAKSTTRMLRRMQAEHPAVATAG